MGLGFSKIFNYFYLGLSYIQTALRSLLAGRLNQVFIALALVINIISWLGVYFLQRSIGSELAVLHYNVVFGIDLIGNASRLYFVPTIGLAIIVINWFLAAVLLGTRERLLVTISLVAALVANFFCLVSLYFIYLINFS